MAVTLGQSYLPNRIGLSSGITLGVAISIGGAVTPLIGKISDIHGVWSGIMTIACLPIFIFLLALNLPDPQSSDKNQKAVHPQGRKSASHDMQKRTVRNGGDSSRDRDFVILKLMAKR